MNHEGHAPVSGPLRRCGSRGSVRGDSGVTVQPGAASRSTPFGYVCRRCNLCCRNKHIQLNPYEVARLARAKGESTGQFRAAWTVDDLGTALRQKADGTCVFLGPEGCGVHADRPLVCRLYPLAQHVRQDGSEYYTRLEGHPQSQGEFTNDGTIADHLTAQGAGPFLEAANRYFQWLCAAHERFALTSDASAAGAGEAVDGVDLTDMDQMIAGYCTATGETEPDHLDDRMKLHLRLLDRAIANVEAADDEKAPDARMPTA